MPWQVASRDFLVQTLGLLVSIDIPIMAGEGVYKVLDEFGLRDWGIFGGNKIRFLDLM
jgi:hypothetical protein